MASTLSIYGETWRGDRVSLLLCMSSSEIRSFPARLEKWAAEIQKINCLVVSPAALVREGIPHASRDEQDTIRELADRMGTLPQTLRAYAGWT
jgi:hypothetical protein